MVCFKIKTHQSGIVAPKSNNFLAKILRCEFEDANFYVDLASLSNSSAYHLTIKHFLSSDASMSSSAGY